MSEIPHHTRRISMRHARQLPDNTHLVSPLPPGVRGGARRAGGNERRSLSFDLDPSA